MAVIINEKAPKRKPNWTEMEQNNMLDLYSNFQDILASRENTIAQCRLKNECWIEITKQLNHLNVSTQRTVEEVKRKWHNFLGQGRRDLYDWKRAQQDCNIPPYVLSPISRRTLELHRDFDFDDWQNRIDKGSIGNSMQDSSDGYLFLDISDGELYEEEKSVEHQTLLDVTPESPTTVIKEEGSTEDVTMCSSPPLVIANTILPTAISSARTTSQQASTQMPRSLAHQQVPSPTALGRNDRLSFLPRQSTINLHGHSKPTSSVDMLASSSNPAVTRAAVSISSASSSSVSSLLETNSLTRPPHGRLTSELPVRKKFREFEENHHRSERETELRLDILQLEKDKLWLETEKLRLEIDILRQQKQQIHNNY